MESSKFSNNTSSAKKKSQSRNTSRKRKQAPIPSTSENEVEDFPSSSTLVNNRSRKQKCVGYIISHKWIVDEVQQKEVWYDGTVLSLLSGNDGEHCAEYDIHYVGDNTSYAVNHLVEDYRDSSVKIFRFVRLKSSD